MILNLIKSYTYTYTYSIEL